MSPPASSVPSCTVAIERLGDLLRAAACTCDASGHLTWYSAGASAIWGRAPPLGIQGERYCGALRTWCTDGTALAREHTPMGRAVRGGEAVRNERLVIERPDGRRIGIVVSSEPLLEEAGRITGAVSVFHEAAALERDVAARARLAAIVETSDDAIISKDLDGIITSWNAAAERIFGYSAEEVIGRPVTMLMPPERHDEEPGILARVRRGERVDHYETLRQRKDGGLIDISLTVSPIFSEDGRVIGASKIARDISDRKRAEAQREELLRLSQEVRARAETENRGKDEFLAMLGHELRNPLSAVRNAITAAMLDVPKRERALEIAHRQADQLRRIVDDVLEVARVTRGSVPLRRQRVSVAELVQRTAEGARTLMDERGHSMSVSLPGAELHLEGDPARLEQALSSLMSNAARYTSPGGTIEIIAERDGEEALIRVRDNGIGIAPELLPQVFDLFTQGSRPLDRTQGGLGIGLTLARRIVELHDGEIEARSAGTGAGSEFVVRLPALPDGAANARMAPSEPMLRKLREQGAAARVLMVEDNPDAAESLVMILELFGHHVRVVSDGRAGLEAARANIPDILLADIGLPGMNGYELAQAVRADPEIKHILLVALTGYGQTEDRARAMAAGFDYYLMKPIDVDALGELVARLGVTKTGRDATVQSRH